MLCTFTDLSVGVARYKSQSVVRPLTYYFRLFPSLPVLLSFACRHLACLILEGVAGYAFKNKTGNVLNNQTKSAQALTTDLG